MSNYNVGVFYMPNWQYTDPNDPLSGNWGAVNDFDTFLINDKHETNRARIPANIYYPSPQWYDESMPSVTSQQLQLMNEHNIDFCVYNSYWTYDAGSGNYVPGFSKPLEHIFAFDKVQGKPDLHNMKIALSWANNFTDNIAQTSCERFFRGGPGGGLDAMIAFWKQFVDMDNYMTFDVIENGETVSRKVFYIYYPSLLTKDFGAINTTDTIEGMCGYCKNDEFFAPLGADANEPYINNKKTKFLLDYIETQMGHKMYFVALMTPYLRGAGDIPDKDYYIKYDWLLQHPQLAGYRAVSSYGYNYFDYNDAYTGPTSSQLDWSYNYGTMQSVYQRFYQYMINNSGIDYHIPVSAGYDQGPINRRDVLNGGSVLNATYDNDYRRDPVDQADSTPATFQQSLINAKNLANSYPDKTRKTILISAWNEYSEGHYIEPTYTWGTQYLDAVKTVFP